MPVIHVDEAMELMKMEYAEMPELKLTFCQARRLWNLSEEMCARALAALMRSGFLRQTCDGSYIRSTTEGLDHSTIPRRAASRV